MKYVVQYTTYRKAMTRTLASLNSYITYSNANQPFNHLAASSAK
jgi:hypothetical protein